MATINNTSRKNVFNLAWSLVKKNGYTMSEALKVAWSNIKWRLKAALGIVKFTFTKVDGTLRLAFGTLNEHYLPETNGSGRKANPTIQTYFDTEKEEWRCFKIANLVNVA